MIANIRQRFQAQSDAYKHIVMFNEHNTVNINAAEPIETFSRYNSAFSLLFECFNAEISAFELSHASLVALDSIY